MIVFVQVRLDRLAHRVNAATLVREVLQVLRDNLALGESQEHLGHQVVQETGGSRALQEPPALADNLAHQASRDHRDLVGTQGQRVSRDQGENRACQDSQGHRVTGESRELPDNRDHKDSLAQMDSQDSQDPEESQGHEDLMDNQANKVTAGLVNYGSTW